MKSFKSYITESAVGSGKNKTGGYLNFYPHSLYMN